MKRMSIVTSSHSQLLRIQKTQLRWHCKVGKIASGFYRNYDVGGSHIACEDLVVQWDERRAVSLVCFSHL